MVHTVFMGSGGTIVSSRATRGVIAWLLLATVLLRAALPVGFMPDPDALQDGRLEIVVCTPTGLKTIMIAAGSTDPLEDDRGGSNRHAIDDCPFHTVVAQVAVVSDAAPNLALPGDATELREPRTSDLPSALALGPPVGSRAPPALIL